jgi:hypothetical protein
MRRSVSHEEKRIDMELEPGKFSDAASRSATYQGSLSRKKAIPGG